MIQKSSFLCVRLDKEDVLKRSLEIAEELWGGGRQCYKQKAGLHTFLQKELESFSSIF